LSGFVEAVGFDVSKEKDKGKFLVEKLEGLLEENSLVIDTQIDVHSCLRPVSGDDVPIIGQTMVIMLSPARKKNVFIINDVTSD